mmetsp:Transcript_63155/g.185256  ORF Transcript_63155/g.185256 Transcript_63155/m.185256 type:complete len:277 (+) Transcript_63155:1929-2759(+)
MCRSARFAMWFKKARSQSAKSCRDARASTRTGRRCVRKAPTSLSRCSRPPRRPGKFWKAALRADAGMTTTSVKVLARTLAGLTTPALWRQMSPMIAPGPSLPTGTCVGALLPFATAFSIVARPVSMRMTPCAASLVSPSVTNNVPASISALWEPSAIVQTTSGGTPGKMVAHLLMIPLHTSANFSEFDLNVSWTSRMIWRSSPLRTQSASQQSVSMSFMDTAHSTAPPASKRSAPSVAKGGTPPSGPPVICIGSQSLSCFPPGVGPVDPAALGHRL